MGVPIIINMVCCYPSVFLRRRGGRGVVSPSVVVRGAPCARPASGAPVHRGGAGGGGGGGGRIVGRPLETRTD